jgi:hypothetical protein
MTENKLLLASRYIVLTAEEAHLSVSTQKDTRSFNSQHQEQQWRGSFRQRLALVGMAGDEILGKQNSFGTLVGGSVMAGGFWRERRNDSVGEFAPRGRDHGVLHQS